MGTVRDANELSLVSWLAGWLAGGGWGVLWGRVRHCDVSALRGLSPDDIIERHGCKHGIGGSARPIRVLGLRTNQPIRVGYTGEEARVGSFHKSHMELIILLRFRHKNIYQLLTLHLSSAHFYQLSLVHRLSPLQRR